MNYINFKYLKPTLVPREGEEDTYDIVYIMVNDNHPYEPMVIETLIVGNQTLHVPWVLLGADFIADVN